MELCTKSIVELVENMFVSFFLWWHDNRCAQKYKLMLLCHKALKSDT